jgi:hypothetical protein
VLDRADGAHLVPELLLPHAEEALQPGRFPMYTDPKPPPPSFSEKFLVLV